MQSKVMFPDKLLTGMRIKSYEFLDALDKEARLMLEHADQSFSVIRAYFLGIDYSGRPYMVITVHRGSFLCGHV